MKEYTYKNYTYQASNYGGTMLSDQYNTLIDLLQSNKPKRICELGCGQTTLIFQQYCQKYKNITLLSIEHLKKWWRENTLLFPIIQNTNITINEKVYTNINKYKGFEQQLNRQKPFDFICIDGPSSWGFREKYNYSRVQLLSFILLNKINHNSVVLFHDSQRKNAKVTLQEFQTLLLEKDFKFQKNITPSSSDFNPAQLTYYQIN